MAKSTLNFGADSFVEAAPLKETQSIKRERKNKTISMTLRQSDLDLMDRYCDETGMSRSNLIRLAVRKYIENTDI